MKYKYLVTVQRYDRDAGRMKNETVKTFKNENEALHFIQNEHNIAHYGEMLLQRKSPGVIETMTNGVWPLDKGV